MMKKILSVCFFTLFVAIVLPLHAHNRYDLIPAPVSLIEKEGAFTINSQTVIHTPSGNKDLEKIAILLGEYLETATDFEPIIQVGKKQPQGHAILFNQNTDLAEDEYRLDVNPSLIRVESATSKGAFYAVQTLLQLLPPEIYARKPHLLVSWSVPCCIIRDKPRFAYRGLHLDVCSHFFPVDFIKRYLDLMAIHKLNVFHWHLTEDQGWRIEIKRYPELTQKGSIRKETVVGTYKSEIYDGKPYGGYYTQAEIKEIVHYAAERFITVIPEIEMPGHSLAAIACYPHLSCEPEEHYEVGARWGIYRQVYCPKPATFEFLENVLKEVMELFPSEYIHIGGDECPKIAWKQCPHCQKLIRELNLKDEFELQSYFIQRMEKFVNANGRKIIGWDEILQGGLAPNATVMSWLGEEGGIKSAQQHHDVVMTPHTKYYLDYYQANPKTEKLCMGHLVSLKEVYLYNPVPDTLTLEQRKHIKGIQGCVWTEYMTNPARVEYMAFPRAAAISETAWTTEDNRNWNRFTRRLENHFKRLEQLHVNYCKSFYDVDIRIHEDDIYSKVVTLSIDAPDAEIRYTLDGSAPTFNSPPYTTPFVINKSETVKALAFRDGKPVGKETQNNF